MKVALRFKLPFFALAAVLLGDTESVTPKQDEQSAAVVVDQPNLLRGTSASASSSFALDEEAPTALQEPVPLVLFVEQGDEDEEGMTKQKKNKQQKNWRGLREQELVLLRLRDKENTDTDAVEGLIMENEKEDGADSDTSRNLQNPCYYSYRDDDTFPCWSYTRPNPTPTRNPTPNPSYANELTIGPSWKLAEFVVGGYNYLAIGSKEDNGSNRFTEPITFVSNGTTTANAENHKYNAWTNAPTKSSEGPVFGNLAVQIGSWRISTRLDLGHLSVGHKDGNVARIYRSDGSIHGNVPAWNDWINFPDIGVPTCAFLSDSGFLQIGNWRIGQLRGGGTIDHLSVGHMNGNIASIYRASDGTTHGNVIGWNPWSLATGNVVAGSSSGCPASFELTIGPWKLADMYRDHLSISSKADDAGNGSFEPIIFQTNGIAGSNLDSYNAWERSLPANTPKQGAIFGNLAVQIGNWRISARLDQGHLSVGHKDGNVARIYRSDGSIHGNVSAWNDSINFPDIGVPTCAFMSDSGFLQIGNWRIGQLRGGGTIHHLSVGHKNGNISSIYRASDGTTHGNVIGWNPWSLAAGNVVAGSSLGCPT